MQQPAKRFYSVSEVAAEFDAGLQTVRDWIKSGQLAAIQVAERGNYKIPAQAVLVMKQQLGLLPLVEFSLPMEPTRTYHSAADLYEQEIRPRLDAYKMRSVGELVERAEDEVALVDAAREVLPLYTLYLAEKKAEISSRPLATISV